MTAMFSQRGGARLGRFNASWPFASLRADDHGIALSCLGSEYRFPKDSIRGLSEYRGFFSTGLRIEHAVSLYPEFMIFWTFAFQNLKRNLEQLGYEVRDTDFC
jgi:hypothetical protein